MSRRTNYYFHPVGSVRTYGSSARVRFAPTTISTSENAPKKGGGSQEKTTREVTNWLIPAGGVHTTMRSFSQQTPTTYYVETLEACQLYTLSYQEYEILLRSHPTLVVKIFEQVFVMAEARLRLCNLRYPEDRLRMFELTYPGKTSHLSVNVQASYLNIDPSTLSRWRGKIR